MHSVQFASTVCFEELFELVLSFVIQTSLSILFSIMDNIKWTYHYWEQNSLVCLSSVSSITISARNEFKSIKTNGINVYAVNRVMYLKHLLLL